MAESTVLLQPSFSVVKNGSWMPEFYKLRKMNKQKSILWINYLKAICIIGVFFVHCNLYYGYDMHGINAFVHPFYVNAFFFVSGYLLFRKQLSEPLISQKSLDYLLGGG